MVDLLDWLVSQKSINISVEDVTISRSDQLVIIIEANELRSIHLANSSGNIRAKGQLIQFSRNQQVEVKHQFMDDILGGPQSGVMPGHPQ